MVTLPVGGDVGLSGVAVGATDGVSEGNTENEGKLLGWCDGLLEWEGA